MMKSKLLVLLFACVGVASAACPSAAQNVQTLVDYRSTVTTGSADGAALGIKLKAELNYNAGRTNAPIAVVMHGFSETGDVVSSVRANAQRLRDSGFFVVSVAMRGRQGGEGTRDNGGVEIYDIYDAVEHVKKTYPGLVDPTNVSITGYSGGGGNAMSAVTKFPDYFRAASGFFGMSDYGFDPSNGWYQNGSSAGHRAILDAVPGNPGTGGAAGVQIRDRYMARASNLASVNNPYSEVHLFVNGDETTCPPINSLLFKQNAVDSMLTDYAYGNISVHIGQAGSYHDFNGNRLNEANEQQHWPHQAPTANQQAAAEQWYLSRLLAGTIAQPSLADSGALVISGYAKTRRFTAWLGTGENAVASLNYELSSSSMTFDLGQMSQSSGVIGWLEVDTSALSGSAFDLYRNGALVERAPAAATYRFNGIGLNDSLRLVAVPEPSTLLSAGVASIVLMSRRRARR